jgi:hypothetical protein
MKYTGSTDAPGQTKARPGTEKLIDILNSRWGFSNLGIYANRPMRGSNLLSVHATGRAVDAGLPKNKQADQAWVSQVFDWLVANHVALGIEEVHQYWFKDWGRAFRCSRKELGGKPGVKVWTATDNGGTPGGKWLHIELAAGDNGGFADDPVGLTKAWKSVSATAPAPNKP